MHLFLPFATSARTLHSTSPVTIIRTNNNPCRNSNLAPISDHLAIEKQNMFVLHSENDEKELFTTIDLKPKHLVLQNLFANRFSILKGANDRSYLL